MWFLWLPKPTNFSNTTVLFFYFSINGIEWTCTKIFIGSFFLCCCPLYWNEKYFQKVFVEDIILSLHIICTPGFILLLLSNPCELKVPVEFILFGKFDFFLLIKAIQKLNRTTAYKSRLRTVTWMSEWNTFVTIRADSVSYE